LNIQAQTWISPEGIEVGSGADGQSRVAGLLEWSVAMAGIGFDAIANAVKLPFLREQRACAGKFTAICENARIGCLVRDILFGFRKREFG
jgi:hypothetical protein